MSKASFIKTFLLDSLQQSEEAEEEEEERERERDGFFLA